MHFAYITYDGGLDQKLVTLCGLVRRFDTRTPGNSYVATRARVLHISDGDDNGGKKSGFVGEPGIAQSVHWFRDRDSGLTEELMASLISSELQVHIAVPHFFFGLKV